MTKYARLAFFILIAAVLVAASIDQPVLAQCAMCKQAVEGSTDGKALANGINLAVLVLLVPPVSIFAGLFGFFYKYRNNLSDAPRRGARNKADDI
jgi:hypothetical protein